MGGVLSFYEENADRYVAFERAIEANPERFPLLSELRQREQELLRQCRGRRTFYFAAGSGANPLILVESGAHVVTLDFSDAMIHKARALFDGRGVPYQVIDGSLVSQDTLDAHLQSESNGILIVKGDFRETAFPEDYFDDVFCYCTLPLLGKTWERGLRGLLSLAKNGAVSVYDYGSRETLREYYVRAGFHSRVRGRAIYKGGGFAYQFLDPEKMKTLIAPKRDLVIEQVGLGNIYRWANGTKR